RNTRKKLKSGPLAPIEAFDDGVRGHLAVLRIGLILSATVSKRLENAGISDAFSPRIKQNSLRPFQ
ncbi:MAG: hypothetical protein MUC58_07165, partial [Rhizobiaceae bacterium]|nr:hypothetical protein [Rhizobiaceae bacterium]